ncbi:unnamed protein product [Moneuplotes crassus]|uniref:Uncharacterized protein n=1 Tax=Euplotes crassus TaxID=5936 RepID=A0AAD1XQ45_EUPCR|nr:unnamed protein product [Moneuplotes crassus]
MIDVDETSLSSEMRDAKLRELCKNVIDNKPKIVDKIKRAFPTLNFLDCHKIRALLQDLKRAGKLVKFIKETPSKKAAEKNSQEAQEATKNKEETKAKSNGENIPPNQAKRPRPYYVGSEALRGKKRKSKAVSKLRETLTMKSKKKDPNQMGIETFLVPKRRKKTDNSQFLMMGCSDSYSCMPASSQSSIISTESRVRSKKRLNKLMGKKSVGSKTRSRLNSNDFHTEEDCSSLSALQTIKTRKRNRLNYLKSEDMMLMSACEEDSAISVQSHITRKFRKRKAIPFTHS